MGEHAPVWKKGGSEEIPPVPIPRLQEKVLLNCGVDTSGISSIPVLPPDNEKARWPTVGSVTKQAGVNEKARNQPVTALLGSPAYSRQFGLKAE